MQLRSQTMKLSVIVYSSLKHFLVLKKSSAPISESTTASILTLNSASNISSSLMPETTKISLCEANFGRCVKTESDCSHEDSKLPYGLCTEHDQNIFCCVESK